MRIITQKRLREYGGKHPRIATTLAHWTELVLAIEPANFVELRRVFPSADQVTVESGRTVTIFNITNHFRLITAIHYNRQLVFILRLLTHTEYDRPQWKENL